MQKSSKNICIVSNYRSGTTFLWWLLLQTEEDKVGITEPFAKIGFMEPFGLPYVWDRPVTPARDVLNQIKQAALGKNRCIIKDNELCCVFNPRIEEVREEYVDFLVNNFFIVKLIRSNVFDVALSHAYAAQHNVWHNYSHLGVVGIERPSTFIASEPTHPNESISLTPTPKGLVPVIEVQDNIDPVVFARVYKYTKRCYQKLIDFPHYDDVIQYEELFTPVRLRSKPYLSHLKPFSEIRNSKPNKLTDKRKLVLNYDELLTIAKEIDIDIS